MTSGGRSRWEGMDFRRGSGFTNRWNLSIADPQNLFQNRPVDRRHFLRSEDEGGHTDYLRCFYADEQLPLL